MSDNNLQCFFMGTGTSTGLPLAPCLTLSSELPPDVADIKTNSKANKSNGRPSPGVYDPEGPWPKNVSCGSCRAAVDKDVPEGYKNKRGNTSMVIRKKIDGKWFNVVLDVGKTFRENATRFFPVWGVQTIDAVILTHGHADAFFGMDDLREWCIRQRCTIPVYLNRPTYDRVALAFPYMVDKTQASGGGDVPSLKFHIIEDMDEFDVGGIKVNSFPTYHGIYFRQPEESESNKSPKPLPVQVPPKDVEPEPLICLGYVFDKSLVYMGDVSSIPDRVWSFLKGLRPNKTVEQVNGEQAAETARTSLEASVTKTVAELDLDSGVHASRRANSDGTPSGIFTQSPNPLILVIDSLWPLRTHSSHFNFPQALDTALRLGANMSYLTGFSHPTTHFIWEELCLSIRELDGQRDHPDADAASALVQKVWQDRQFSGELGKKLKSWGGKVEPSFDGLKLEISPKGWTEVETRSLSF